MGRAGAALAQGFEPSYAGERRLGRAVEGVRGFVDLVALGWKRQLNKPVI